jgi:hypothetical protein
MSAFSPSVPSSATPPSILPFNAKLRPNLPHPKVFEGAKLIWRGWKLEIKNKLTIDAIFINNAYAQINYVYSHFGGKTRENVTIFVKNAFIRNDVEPNHLLIRLDILYGEKDRKQKAINNLHNLRQKDDEPFANFFPQFERKISNAEAD